MNRLLRKGLACALLACAGLAVSADQGLVLRMAEGATPSWSGIGPGESAGTAGSMMYPAPNAAGLLGAILTHALLAQGSRSSEREAQQARADQVLAPYRDTIAELTTERLLSAAHDRLPATLQQPASPRTVEVQPSFAMAADQQALMLDNVIRLSIPGGSPTLHRIRVISPPVGQEDATGHWQQNQGQALKDQAATMLAHSVELALTLPPVTPADTGFRTQRYRLGGQEKMERGKPVAQGCGRIVLHTLRDWLLSAPVPVSTTAPCGPPSYSMQGDTVTAAAAAPGPLPATAAAGPDAAPPAPAGPATPPH